jgi:hypothetical protein
MASTVKYMSFAVSIVSVSTACKPNDPCDENPNSIFCDDGANADTGDIGETSDTGETGDIEDGVDAGSKTEDGRCAPLTSEDLGIHV